MDKTTVETAELSLTFTQEADSYSQGIQLIKVNVEDAGGKYYYTLSTKRWAFDNIKDLVSLLNKVKQAAIALGIKVE